MEKRAVFGLGNYGPQYKKTRHNIGFEILDFIKDSFFEEKKINFEVQKNWESASEFIDGKKVFFVKVKDFINNSGTLIKKFMKKEGIKSEEILIIQDDVSIDFCKVKFKKNSSSGGHNGIKSLIKELGTENFCRIKVGVGKVDSQDLKSWVLSNINEEEFQKLKTISFEKVKNLLIEWIQGKIQY